MKKVFCFGELLLRFSPNLQKQWIQEHTMPVFIGGAELNVVKALSNWGMPVKYCTALPDNYISKEIIESLQDQGIDNIIVNLVNDTHNYTIGEHGDEYYLKKDTSKKILLIQKMNNL
jgi:sugar/nucleoside kinase (ribokinase family)